MELDKEVFQENVPLNSDGSQYIHTVKCGLQNKKKVLLIHGYGGTNMWWMRMYKELAKVYCVYSIDLPGMGLSSRCKFPCQSEEETIAFFVNHLETWRQQVGWEEFEIISHSFGAYIGSFYTLAHKQRVTKLFLISPAGITKKEIYDDLYVEFVKEQGLLAEVHTRFNHFMWKHKIDPFQFVRSFGFLRRWVIRSLAKEKFGRIAGDAGDRKIIEDMYEELCFMPDSSEKCIFNLFHKSFTAYHPLEERFVNELELPIIFLFGDQDWMDPSGAKRVKEGYKGRCEILTAPNSGHQVTVDNWEECNRVILAEFESEFGATEKKEFDQRTEAASEADDTNKLESPSQVVVA
eukprot:TRINITY_DN2084_c0_g1_i3.p1 TRINITY_DN2084_c0_g1~~TRINITY_DN2084_c0_g1_i3.p1  ORF type:complete len:349 (-),score=100.13 TRINITY_DN2084_c0_g1_i3:270-1316(-)